MTLDEDLRAIEALNQHDVKAALAGDIRAIASQWTDDFVVLSSGPTLRGREAHVLMLERGAEHGHAFVSIDYTVAFEEITVLGDYAYEWGTYRGSMRPRDGGETISYGGKLLRILQRQPDGAWKMHRTMMTSEPAQR